MLAFQNKNAAESIGVHWRRTLGREADVNLPDERGRRENKQSL
jgi:hypothetical protein